MSTPKVILVTGSSSGIGFELVRLLAQQGHTVYIGARNVEKGQKAKEELITSGLKTVKFVELDVTSDKSVEAARQSIETTEGHLDSLVNNAAIAGHTGRAAIDVEPSASVNMVLAPEETMATNYIGAVRVCTAFIPLLRKAAESSTPTILNVSSSLGSNTWQSTHVLPMIYAPYAATKAALNSYTIHLAADLKASRFKINVATPGYTASGFNKDPKARPTREGAVSLLPWVVLDKDGPTGKFFQEDGKEQVW